MLTYITTTLFFLTTAFYLVILCERDYNTSTNYFNTLVSELQGLINVYGDARPLDHLVVYAAVKVIPMIVLLLHILLRGLTNSKYNFIIFAGLFSSSFGDVFLVWGDKLFLYGMIAFGIAHILYVLAFGFTVVNPLLGLVCYLLGFLSFYNLTLGNLPDKYYYPVILYHFLIASMIWRAFSSTGFKTTTQKRLVVLGAALFAVSDAVLGHNKFHTKFQAAHMIIMVTYFLAQFFIAMSTDSVSAKASKKLNDKKTK